jgi:tRNA threonylcarbamoyladenosine biosynthesis protein TsaB
MNEHGLTKPEPVILAVDSSSKLTSVAVRQGKALLRSTTSPLDEKRSDTLWSEVQRLLAGVDLEISDVDVFSVSVGPGSFTGLRVGMAAVKGFAAALSKPIISVTSLEAVAFAASPAVYVCAMVKAYRGEVYSQLFSFDDDGVPVAQDDPIVSTRERAIERVANVEVLVFAGDGAEELVAGNGPKLGEGNRAITLTNHCLAEDIAALALLKQVRGEFETAASLRACYVQPAAAEIKLSLGLLGSKIKRSMKP